MIPSPAQTAVRRAGRPDLVRVTEGIASTLRYFSVSVALHDDNYNNNNNSNGNNDKRDLRMRMAAQEVARRRSMDAERELSQSLSPASSSSRNNNPGRAMPLKPQIPLAISVGGLKARIPGQAPRFSRGGGAVSALDVGGGDPGPRFNTASRGDSPFPRLDRGGSRGRGRGGGRGGMSANARSSRGGGFAPFGGNSSVNANSSMSVSRNFPSGQSGTGYLASNPGRGNAGDRDRPRGGRGSRMIRSRGGGRGGGGGSSDRGGPRSSDREGRDQEGRGGRSRKPKYGPSPEELEYNEREECGVIEVYNPPTPQALLGDLAGYLPAMATANTPLANQATVQEEARVLGGGRRFHPDEWYDPRLARDMYNEEGTGIYFASGDARQWTSEATKNPFVFKRVGKETRSAVLEAALLGKYEDPGFAKEGDTMANVQCYVRRDGDYKMPDERMIEKKVASLVVR